MTLGDDIMDSLTPFDEFGHNYSIKAEYTQFLEGNNIALLISGSVAAENASKIARELKRYGGNVTAYLTESALKYTTKDLMESATGNPAVIELTGLKAEHLSEYDAFLLAPGTASTIGNIASGSGGDSDPVKTAAIAAMGSLHRGKSKFIVAPAMHGVMWDNPIFQDNLDKLQRHGVKVIDPIQKNESDDTEYLFKEDKAKLAGIDTIVVETIRELSTDNLKGVNVLMDLGSTVSYIDNVRYIGNVFRGQLGRKIAKELYMRGANVKAIFGNSGGRIGGLEEMPYLDAVVVNSFDDMRDAMVQEAEKGIYSAIICAAAINDYSVNERYDGKISSDDKLSVEFKENEKIVQLMIDKAPDSHITSFKLENKKTVSELIDIGQKRMQNGHNIVVGNLLEETYAKAGQHISYIMRKDDNVIKALTNMEIANILLDLIGSDLKSKKIA